MRDLVEVIVGRMQAERVGEGADFRGRQIGHCPPIADAAGGGKTRRYFASWKMMPSVYLVPRWIVLTPWRSAARYQPR